MAQNDYLLEVITTVAIILAFNWRTSSSPVPGWICRSWRPSISRNIRALRGAVQSSSHGIMGTILSLVPTNIVASMAKGEMLPIIFFSVLFGLGLSSCPRRIAVNCW
ncbi:cation:dicarboxylate symporter family transporter [Escherichia coli]